MCSCLIRIELPISMRGRGSLKGKSSGSSTGLTARSTGMLDQRRPKKSHSPCILETQVRLVGLMKTMKPPPTLLKLSQRHEKMTCYELPVHGALILQPLNSKRYRLV